MMKELQDTILGTPEKRSHALVELQNLEQHQGWLLVKEMLRYNIKILEQRILNTELSEEEATKLKKLRKYLLNLIDFPSNQIKNLLEHPESDHVVDPYD